MNAMRGPSGEYIFRANENRYNPISNFSAGGGGGVKGSMYPAPVKEKNIFP